MSKTLHRNLQAKIASLKGPEWDSSDDDSDAEQENSVKVDKQKQSIAERKRSKKEATKNHRQAIQGEDNMKDDEDPNVIYIGHLPNELEESDLRTFLSQFGKVENSRISRSVKTGGSRGYAFVKFTVPGDAKIVAETLEGYFLGNRRLVCHLVKKPDDGMFYDTGKLIVRRKTLLEAEKKRREHNLASANKMKEITERLVQREKKKRKKLKELGIDYDFPGYEEANENMMVEEEEENKTSKNKKRKDSVDSTSSSSRKRKDSISSQTSATRKSKRKDSVGSESSARKRKESIGSVGSTSSKRSTRSSIGDDSKAEKVTKNVPQSEQKNKKKKKGNRRLSA